jgi:WD40 repeat protein
MPRTHAFSVTFVLCSAALLLAAPAAKDPPTTPITAANASRLQVVQEVPSKANRIIRGPNRGELILLDWNNTADVVDEMTLRPLRPLLKDRKPVDLAVSRDGKLVAWSMRDKKVYTVQDLGDGKTFEIEMGEYAGDAAFSPDGKVLAIGSTFWDPKAEGVGHSEMKLFDLKGKLVRTLEKNGPGGVRPVFSSDGKLLAISNRNHGTQLFDVDTGKLLHKLDKRMTQEVVFSPDDKTIACGYVDGTVAIWDVSTGKLLHSEKSGCKEIYSVTWNPKGDVLASSGRDGKIILWEPSKFEKLKELEAPFWVIQVRFTADGSRLMAASAADHSATTDRKIVVWAVPR